MQFDIYPAQKNSSRAVSVFYGLDRSRRPLSGEAEDMLNMAPFEFPCAAPRGARYRVGTVPGTVGAVSAPDAFATDTVAGFTGVAGGAFYYNGSKRSGNITLSDAMRWKIVRFCGLYIINGYSGRSSQLYCYNVDTDRFYMAGNVMDNLIVTAGADANGNYLATIQFRYNYVDEYTTTDAEGKEIRNSDFFDKYWNYGNVAPADNIFEGYFKVGDEVSLSGFPSLQDSHGQVWSYSTTREEVTPQTATGYSDNNTADTDAYASTDDISRYQVTDATVKSFDTRQMTVQGNRTFIHYIYFDLYNKNGEPIDFLETEGAAGSFYVSGVTLSSRRRCFTDIAAHQGRLWGVSPSGRVIYGSASDIIFSFSAADINAKYAARLTDSASGRFTALCSYGGELAAFKPEEITVISGTGVRNYSVNNIYGIGCIDGRSVSATPYGIIFLSERGFCCWSGGTPQLISERLSEKYISASAAVCGDIYYAAAVREDGERELLTCDLRRGMWHLQDDAEADGLFAFSGRMYMVSDGIVYEMTETDADDIEWSFTAALTTDGTLDNKSVIELWIRAEIADGAELTAATAAGGGVFREHSTFTEPGLHVFRCPVRALMADSYRVRLSGRGRVVIYDLEIRTAQGGRKYKKE